MSRPAVTKGDVARVVAGAIAGGLLPGTFEVRVEHGRVRILPAKPTEEQPDSSEWDDAEAA